MGRLTPLESQVYNDGERFIPGVTHNLPELVRHRSSYELYKELIAADLAGSERSEPVTIVDLGSGAGWGVAILATIPGVHVTGVDVSAEAVKYAEEEHGAANITFEVHDLAKYVPDMPTFDYVVSRGALEHVVDGLNLAAGAKWRERLIIDVPYDEAYDENHHHELIHIKEEHFEAYESPSFFYEGMDGAIGLAVGDVEDCNMIGCVCSREGLPLLADVIAFPRAPWAPGENEASELYAWKRKRNSFFRRLRRFLRGKR
ncbi:MAG: class I SAM-dependent methyltransferase [Planctomycetota bacterium]|nr:class I SAM-dependent methyltransferase [Planctomycetota bacterium]